LEHLPPISNRTPEKIEERQREKEVLRDRLAKLWDVSPRIQAHINHNLAQFNGRPGEPQSFDALHELLENQAYRLAYWKTASARN